MTNLERFDILMAERSAGLSPGELDSELRHIAEHLGMGDMRTLHVSLEQVRAFFLRLPSVMQQAALADIDTCPW